MKSFAQYIQEREETSDMGGLGDLSMSGTAPEETLLRISKLLIKSHKKEYLAFITHLAQSDQRLGNELETYRQDCAGGLKVKKKNDSFSGDEVMPNAADKSSGAEEGGEGD